MTTTTTPSTALVPADPVFSEPERLALAGFLAGVLRLNPRGLCPGSAPVRGLVP